MGGHCASCLLRIGLVVAGSAGPDVGEALSNDPLPAKIRYLGDYELIQEIGRGGMGVVYQARQASLNRLVALKLIRAGELADQAEVARFHAEAEAAAHLDHANIVPIYEVGENEGWHYFSMKLIEGGTLAERMPNDEGRMTKGGQECRPPPFDLRHSAFVISQVARAVHYAHQRGILHRDLKPGNILLDTQGEPHITDFGLARRIDTDSGLTRTGAIVGTPSYMAPEQAKGAKQLTTAADMYSLGAILYELLAGRPPFVGATGMETLQKVINEEPVPPSKANAERGMRNAESCDPPARRLDSAFRISHSAFKDLETICLKCLEKDPARRYGSAEALADDLDCWQRGEPIHARPVTTAERFSKWTQRNPLLAGSLAALLLVTLLGFAGIIWQWRHAKTEAARAQSAEQQAKHRFAESLVNQARALQAARRPGRGFDSLAALDTARALRPGLVSASDIISSSALLDIRPSAPPDFLPQDRPSVWVDVEGGWFAIAESNGVRVLRSAVTNETFFLTGAPSSVSNVIAFSPNARFLATASKDGDIQIWNLGERRLHLSLVAPSNSVPSILVFSPDSRGFVYLQARRLVGWVDLAAHSKSRSHKAPHAVLAMAYSLDGERLAVAGSDAIEILDGHTFEHIEIIPHHQDSAGLAWHPGNRWLAASGSKGVTLWDTRSQQAGATLRTGRGVRGIAFLPGGEVLVTLGEDGFVRAWDFLKAEQVMVWPRLARSGQFSKDGSRFGFRPGQTSPIHFLEFGGVSLRRKLSWVDSTSLSSKRWSYGHNRFSPDGRFLAYTTPWEVRLHDIRARRDIATIDVEQVMGLFFRTEPPELLLYSHFNWERWPLNLAANSDHWSVGPRQWLSAYGGGAGDPIRDDLIAVHAQSWVRFLDLDSWRIRSRLKPPAPASVPRFSPDGQWLSFVTYDSRRLFVYRIADTNLSHDLSFSPPIEHATFTPDSRSIVVASGGKRQFYELGTGRVTQNIPVREANTKAGVSAFTPDGNLLAAAEYPSAIRLYDVNTGGFLAELQDESTVAVTSLHFSPDGSFLAVTRGISSTELWDIDQVRNALAQRNIRFPGSRAGDDPLAPDSAPLHGPAMILRGNPQPNEWSSRLQGMVPRQPGLSSGSLDLRIHYTSALTNGWHKNSPSNHLGPLMEHPVTYADINFDVGGWLRLAGSKPSEVDWPTAVRNIAVQRKCRRIHFLHGTGLTVEDGTPVARYIVQYQGGAQRIIPVRYGEHVRDWWRWNLNEPEGVTLAKIVHLPPNPASVATKTGLRAFVLTWENPKPNDPITSLDFVSEMTDCAPFLLGITVEE